MKKILAAIGLSLLIATGCNVQDNVDTLVEDVNSTIDEASTQMGEEVDNANAALEDASNTTDEAVENVEDSLDEASEKLNEIDVNAEIKASDDSTETTDESKEG